MTTDVRRWTPLPLHLSLARWRDRGDLADRARLRREVPHGTTWDVPWNGGLVRLSLSAWDGGTSIEAVPVDVAPRAAARLLDRVTQALQDAPQPPVRPGVHRPAALSCGRAAVG